jgi:hypothetical protein
MPRVLMNFHLHDGWIVHFIQADARSTLGPRTRYFQFATEEEFRAFVSRCNVEDLDEFEAACETGPEEANTASSPMSSTRSSSGESIAELPSNARTRDILASEQAEAEAQPFANDIVAPGHCLELRLRQVPISGVSAEDLRS